MALVNKEIAELKKRREQIAQGGGEKAIEKHLAMGKMTARDRVRSIAENPDDKHFHRLRYSVVPAMYIFITSRKRVIINEEDYL